MGFAHVAGAQQVATDCVLGSEQRVPPTTLQKVPSGPTPAGWEQLEVSLKASNEAGGKGVPVPSRWAQRGQQLCPHLAGCLSTPIIIPLGSGPAGALPEDARTREPIYLALCPRLKRQRRSVPASEGGGTKERDSFHNYVPVMLLLKIAVLELSPWWHTLSPQIKAGTSLSLAGESPFYPVSLTTRIWGPY